MSEATLLTSVLSAAAGARLAVRPLSVAHRILRSLRLNDRSDGEVTEYVLSDGHVEPAPAAITSMLTRMVQEDLLAFEPGRNGTRDGLYGLTDEGERILKALELEVHAAQQAALRTPAAGAADTRPQVQGPINVWDSVTPAMRTLLSRSIRRQSGHLLGRTVPVFRDGAMDHESIPSRHGDRLHFRDGRITTLDGAVVQPPSRSTT